MSKRTYKTINTTWNLAREGFAHTAALHDICLEVARAYHYYRTVEGRPATVALRLARHYADYQNHESVAYI